LTTGPARQRLQDQELGEVSVTGSFFQVQVWRSGSIRKRPRSRPWGVGLLRTLPSFGARAAQDRLERSTRRRCENGLRMKSSRPS